MASENENGVDQDVEVPTRTKLMTLDYASSTTILQDFFPSTQRAFSTTERINRLGMQAGEEESERQLGVSMPWRLYEDPWKIKKILANTDINHSSRLLVPKNLVLDHILPFFDVNELQRNGVRVKIWDHDTGSEHQMKLKRWISSNSYIFNGEWSKEFVRRRNLVKGDQIGLFWSPYDSRFHFSVLSRALPNNNRFTSTLFD